MIAAVNRPGKHDASGAFVPEGTAWSRANQASELFLDAEGLSAQQVRDAVLDQLFRPQHRGLQQVAFFCHGFPRGIGLGFHGRDGAACLAAGIQSATEQGTVILYSCSAGQWFAGELARMLGEGFAVWSHMGRGHTTRNPRLCYARGSESIDVWAQLTWTRRRRLRELLRGPARLQLGAMEPPRLFEILDRPLSDTPG